MRTGLVAVAAALVATSCGFHTIAPTGDFPLRYRDAVFDEVRVTSGVTYGRAVGQQGATVDLQLDIYEPTGDAVA